MKHVQFYRVGYRAAMIREIKQWAIGSSLFIITCGVASFVYGYLQ